jgi:hypothetical protein
MEGLSRSEFLPPRRGKIKMGVTMPTLLTNSLLSPVFAEREARARCSRFLPLVL